MRESSKAMLRRFANKEESEFWKNVFSGSGIDVGSGDDPITVEGVKKFDIEDGDANKLADYVDATFDYVHASQCLEHMHDPKAAVKQWMSVLKPGGYLVVTVPSWELYEGMVWPSRYNSDHKATFSMWQQDSPAPHHVKLPEWLESNFPQHSVCLCRLVDTNYNYKIGATVDQTYKYENRVEAFIEFVVQKARNTVRENITEAYGDDLLFMDEAHFDDAILGVAERADGNHVVAYDTVRVLQILEREMSPDEAREYFDFNISCAWVGDKTPVYISSLTSL